MSEPRQITRTILRNLRTAEPEHVVAGLQWYEQAFVACQRLAHWYDYSTEHAVVALAHLSPRMRWQLNLTSLELLLAGQDKPAGMFTTTWNNAVDCLQVEQPLATFSRRALKTRSFAQAILGDTSAVTVDVWTARAAGVEERSITTMSGYIAVADAYRRAARHVELPARDIQAITWCQQRGAAA